MTANYYEFHELDEQGALLADLLGIRAETMEDFRRQYSEIKQQIAALLAERPSGPAAAPAHTNGIQTTEGHSPANGTAMESSQSPIPRTAPLNTNAYETYRNLRRQRKESQKWVPREEVKRDLCIGDKKLRQLLRDDLIPNIPIGGGVRLIPRHTYTKWLETGSHEGGSK